MVPSSLLIANRGEIAIRVTRAAAELGIRTVALYAEDDAQSLHTRKADESRPLEGVGVGAYLDGEQIIELAKDAGCDAVHPGYGFLSENAAFARRCDEEGLVFVGPRVAILELFGDKVRARSVAEAAGVPVLAGTSAATSLEEAQAFLSSLGDGGAMMIKAVAGGGGRGVRVVRSVDEIEDAYNRCQSEAKAAFGRAALYVEQLVTHARHVEVQILGDGSGNVCHLGERDCSIQRRHQKLVEIAPAPGFPASLRERVTSAALTLAREVRYDNLGTFEFLVDADNLNEQSDFAFIEANPRLQVEHTVTEEVTGVDLVQAQLQLAAGRSLEELGLVQSEIAPPRGFAIQVRINMERMGEDGGATPSGGTLSAFEPSSGPGIRTDSFGYVGYTTSPRYDSLLAKLIGHSSSPRFEDAVTKTYRALCEFRVDGVPTNIGFLQSILRHDAFRSAHIYTRFIDEHASDLMRAPEEEHQQLFFKETSPAPTPGLAGVRVDGNDPLAVLSYGRAGSATSPSTDPKAATSLAMGPAGAVALNAPLQGTIVTLDVREGDSVHEGQQLLVMESMKMEHEIRAAISGVVKRIGVAVADTVYEGHPLLFIEEGEVQGVDDAAEAQADLDEIRPDLREVLDRHEVTLDAARPDAVARRRTRGQRTARENVEDICDPGTFVEYGQLVLAAQRRRRSLQELIEKTPADGMITGVGTINGDLFEEPASRCVVMSYDYTVLAGTQGGQNHRKTDRLIDVATDGMMPMVLFAEGGGGRPGDTDNVGGGGRTFARFATLSGLVPMVGITSGRCFAGNASLLGCCDVIIATANSNIGMGGPVMIEGGGLGVFAPEDIGAMDIQVPNGVVDIAVEDEAEAVAVAKRYLSYF
ncbi:MAG: biotin carboxylase N-terminal domain-containing protein, partial [Pseudomonadales bacterium]